MTLGYVAFDDGNARESSIGRWRGEKMESRDGFTRETRFDSVRFDDLAFSLLVNAPQIRICPASTRSQPFFSFSRFFFLFFFVKRRNTQAPCPRHGISSSTIAPYHSVSSIPLKPWESLELSFVDEGDGKEKISRLIESRFSSLTCIHASSFEHGTWRSCVKFWWRWFDSCMRSLLINIIG